MKMNVKWVRHIARLGEMKHMLRIFIQNRRERVRLGDLEMDGNSHCCLRRAALSSHLPKKNCSNHKHCVMILNSSYKTELYSNGFLMRCFGLYCELSLMMAVATAETLCNII